MRAADFFSWLDKLPDAVYRLKGWVCLLESDVGSAAARNFEVQAAGRHWRTAAQVEPYEAGQLVVIGRAGDPALEQFVSDLRLLGRSP
jgi:hypothetical protein